MPRRPRKTLPTPAIYHVTARGVEQRLIVLDEIDRDAWERQLREVAVRFGWEVIVWALMPNHFHVIVRTTQPRLSAGMQRLNGLHAMRFNRRYNRVGHLFQSRFGARVLERDEHYENALGYVVENPNRSRLRNWRWVGRGLPSAQLLEQPQSLLIPRDAVGRPRRAHAPAVRQIPVVRLDQRLRVREARLPAEQPLRLLRRDEGVLVRGLVVPLGERRDAQ